VPHIVKVGIASERASEGSVSGKSTPEGAVSEAANRPLLRIRRRDLPGRALNRIRHSRLFSWHGKPPGDVEVELLASKKRWRKDARG
jgi:hypothetical protein